MHRGPHRQRIWRSSELSPATHEKRVQKDLMTPLREFGIQQQHLLLHRGHLRTSTRVKSENFSDDDNDDKLQKQTRAAVEHAGPAEPQGRGGKGAKAPGRRGIHRLGRELHDDGPDQLRGRARTLPAKSERVWSMFFALIFLFCQRHRVPVCGRGPSPADGHSDPSCDNGALLYPGEDEDSDHDSCLAGRGGLCLVCEENPENALPGANDAATSRATTPRPTDGALGDPTRTDSPHPPCTKSDPTWCTGERW